MASSTAPINPLAKDPTSTGILWVIVCIPTLALTALIVVIRTWWRRRQTGKIGGSDITIWISLLCATTQLTLGTIGILQWGLGHHAAYIGQHNTQMALMYFYLYQIFYKILVCSTKISFILLYVELFPVFKFIVVCHIFNALIVAAGIAFTTATIIQCSPIPYAWDKRIAGGTCIETAAFWYSHAIWNTTFDILVLFLPIPIIRSLNMGKSQKLAVTGVFGLGAFVIRMVSLDPASKTNQADMTYVISTSNAFLWTQVESCAAIICVCLPTLKGPMSRVLPKMFSTRNTTRQSYALEEVSHKDSKIRSYARGSRNEKPAEEASSSQEEIFGIAQTQDTDVNSLDTEKVYKPSVKRRDHGPKFHEELPIQSNAQGYDY